MAMTYDEFRDHVIGTLWRTGDSVLIGAFDNLVRLANTEISKKLRVEARHTSAVLTVLSTRVSKPSDCKTVRGLSDLDEGRGEFKYVTPTKLTELRSIYKNRSWLPYYSLEGSDILLTGPTTDSRQSTGPIPPSSPNEGHLWSRTGSSPGLYVWHVDPTSSQWVQLTAEQAVDATASTSSINLVLDYHREIPDYKAVDASWVEDEYFDLYLYTVCKHAAPYLREDVRLPTWLGLQVDALDSANEESAFYQERAIPQERPLPRQAGISRRRR